MAEIELRALPPEEALTYFRAKELAPSFAWQDVWAEEHARAFTVAKAMRRDILEDIRGALDKALAEGQTLDQFRDALRPTLEAKGWWGRKEMTDPLTGEARVVQLGSPRRLETIFDVNMRTALAAGRWQRIQETKEAFPFLRYVAVQDSRTRPQHRAWHGTVLPVDHPWWNTHYPPCGWRCRCTVQQVNERMLERRNWEVTDKPPAFPMRTYRNPRTGELITLEQGIDPGWSHHVGKAYLDPLTPRPVEGAQTDQVVASLRDAPPPATRPAPKPLDPDVPAEQAEAEFLRVFGASPTKPRIYTDAGGEELAIGPGMFRDAAGKRVAQTPAWRSLLPFAAAALTDPGEIWWVWRQLVDGGPTVMMRRYIARLAHGGELVDVAVEAVAGGASPAWSYSTSLDAGFDLARLRSGELAWRRPPDEE